MWSEEPGRNAAQGRVALIRAVRRTGMPMPATDAVNRKQTQSNAIKRHRPEHSLRDG